MKSASLALALLVVAVLAVPAPLLAQETKNARGTVTALANDSLTVKMADHEMKFVVDAKTTVEAVGAGTRTRQAQAAGQAGPKLTEVLKVGQPVSVSYTESGGSLHAVRIQAVSSVGGAAAADTKTANGKVQSISATSMTIAGSGGSGATFTQTYAIDGNTKVIGRGAGTAAAAAGGKTVVTDLVATGDTVSVTYGQAGTALRAAEIRVTAKAAAK
jgi:Domain of unknown function (DUF5666)